MSGFDTFLGNEALKSSLAREIGNGSLAHAYIIEGAPGSGKRTLAKLIAAAAACREADPPCMKCTDCDKIMRSQSPDVVYVEADTGKVQLGVDIIRKLREDASFAPNDLTRKFYIFPAADSMNIQAQNALLKLLEEPPEFVTFLLLTKSADSLLPTIRSRAPTLRIEPLSRELIENKLPEYSEAAAELKKSDPEAFAIAVRKAAGSLGAAISLCEPESAKAELELHRTADKYLSLLCERGAKNELAFFEFAVKLPIKQRGELAELYSRLRLAVRDLIGVKLAGSSDDFEVLFYTSTEAAHELADKLPGAKLMRLYELFDGAREMLERNIALGLSLNHTAMQALAIMSGRTPVTV